MILAMVDVWPSLMLGSRMKEPSVSLADPKTVDREGLSPSAVVIVVDPGATPLEKALVQDREAREALATMRREGVPKAERASFAGALRQGGKRLKRMIADWRRG
jgi:hypothetical protein